MYNLFVFRYEFPYNKIWGESMKLLASDFDNTLWFEDHMKDEDVKAIHEFQKHGHLFGICSGRSLSGILRPSKPYDIQYDFFILLSGGLILNKDYEPIFESQIPISLVKDIYEFTGKQNMSIVHNDVTYHLNTKFQDHIFDHEIHSFNELPFTHIQAFSFHYQDHELDLAQKMTHLIIDKYGHQIEAFQNNQHIDLAMKGCSKGKGIQIIEKYFHLSHDHVYGIGDNYNDLPMLDAIQHSYSFDYAPLPVQKHAKTIVSQLSKCILDIEK